MTFGRMTASMKTIEKIVAAMKMKVSAAAKAENVAKKKMSAKA
jgi:hypothetical protein